MVAEDPDDTPEFMAAPWQFGFTEDHSVKGKSKLVDIMDRVLLRLVLRALLRGEDVVVHGAHSPQMAKVVCESKSGM